MSIVRNSVLAGNGLTADHSSSVVVWPNVTIGTTTYTFCEYITTNEAGSPTYIRDAAHKDIVRPTGHDYYPCYNGTTYGVYDKINHTFTAKTVTAHGEEDQPYGVGIWDLTWATASGYTDLLTLAAADGGVRDYDDTVLDPQYIIETPSPQDSTHTVRYIPLAFNFNTLPVPPQKQVVEGSTTYTYTYALGSPYVMDNGMLIDGRKPKWNLWADNAPYRTYDTHVISGTRHSLRLNCLDVNDDAPMLWWDGYNSSKSYPPFIKLGDNNQWEIEYHNGVCVICDTSQGFTFPTFSEKAQERLYKYVNGVTNLPAFNMAIGNLVDWNKANDHRVNIWSMQGQIQYNNVYISNSNLVLLQTKPFWSDGTFADTAPSGVIPFGYQVTDPDVIEKAREGKLDGVLFNFATANATINNTVANSFYNTLLLNDGEVDATMQMTLLTPATEGYNMTETAELLGDLTVTTKMKSEDIADGMGYYPRFRMIVKTPTVNLWNGSSFDTYDICNGVYASVDSANGSFANETNSPHRFYFKEDGIYTSNGVGMTFLYAGYDGVEQEYYALDNTQNCLCILELTTCNTDGEIIGYAVLAKHRSQGIYYYNTDPDIDYKNSAWTYYNVATFLPEYLAAAKFPDGTTAGTTPYTDFAEDYTMKVGFFYGNDNIEDIPYTFCDVDENSRHILKPNSTAILGMYGDKCALLTGFNSSVDVDWYDALGDPQGGSYSSAYRDFSNSFRGDHLNIGPNSHDIFVYPYENVIANSADTFSTLYFKRYKNSTVLYQDGGSTPSTDVAPVNYVFLIEIKEANGTIYRAGAKFEPIVGQTNKWQLAFASGTSNIDHIYLSSISVSVYAELTYIQHANSENRYFDVPQFTGLTEKITQTGIFKLQIRTSGMYELGMLRWSMQNV